MATDFSAEIDHLRHTFETISAVTDPEALKAKIADLSETLPDALLQQHQLAPFAESVRLLHQPPPRADDVPKTINTKGKGSPTRLAGIDRLSSAGWVFVCGGEFDTAAAVTAVVPMIVPTSSQI